MTGTEIWKTAGQGGIPFNDWMQVNSSGFDGTVYNFLPRSVIFGGSLYFTYFNALWKTQNGTTWTKINLGSSPSLLFDDSNNTNSAAFTEFNGRLYLGVANPSCGAQLWRSKATVTSNSTLSPSARFRWKNDTATNLQVDLDASSSLCPAGDTCSYAWDLGDSSTATGITASHIYSGGTYTVTLTVTDMVTGKTGTRTAAVTALPIHVKPTVAATGAPTVDLWTVTFTDASTAMPGLSIAPNGVIVNWGDGTVEKKDAGSVFTHEYKRASTFTIMHSATDSGGAVVPAIKLSSTNKYKVTVPVKFTLSGSVTNKSGIGLSNTRVTLKLNGHTVASTSTNAAGNYSFMNKVLPTRTGETYTLQAYKYKYTFPALTSFSATGTMTVPTILSAE